MNARGATLVVITGASRGFGRCVAVAASRRLAAPLRLVRQGSARVEE